MMVKIGLKNAFEWIDIRPKSEVKMYCWLQFHWQMRYQRLPQSRVNRVTEPRSQSGALGWLDWYFQSWGQGERWDGQERKEHAQSITTRKWHYERGSDFTLATSMFLASYTRTQGTGTWAGQEAQNCPSERWTWSLKWNYISEVSVWMRSAAQACGLRGTQREEVKCMLINPTSTGIGV